MIKKFGTWIFLIVQLAIFSIIWNTVGNAKFKINECAQDSIHKDKRKVIKVNNFNYTYLMFNKDTIKWNKQELSMRIKDFDSIMIKIKCPKEDK